MILLDSNKITPYNIILLLDNIKKIGDLSVKDDILADADFVKHQESDHDVIAYTNSEHDMIILSRKVKVSLINCPVACEFISTYCEHMRKYYEEQQYYAFEIDLTHQFMSHLSVNQISEDIQRFNFINQQLSNYKTLEILAFMWLTQHFYNNNIQKLKLNASYSTNYRIINHSENLYDVLKNPQEFLENDKSKIDLSKTRNVQNVQFKYIDDIQVYIYEYNHNILFATTSFYIFKNLPEIKLFDYFTNK